MNGLIFGYFITGCSTDKPYDYFEADTASKSDSEEPNITDTDAPDSDALDSGSGNTSETDSASDTDTVPVDTGELAEERVSCSVSTSFISPQDHEFYMLGTQLTTIVQLDTLPNYNGHSIRWENEAEQELAVSLANGEGRTEYVGTDFSQQKGLVNVYARLITPDGVCNTRIAKPITVCADQLIEDFTTQPMNWTLHGDAYWDNNGWIEMTGISQGRKGAAYNVQDSITQGAASIRFTLKTGNGLNGGADGFAFTIINVNPTDLEGWLDLALSGGGMAYGIGGPYGSWTGDAITVEIDTWHNVYNGSNEFHTDPTSVSHIALTKNADPSNHVVWFEVPTVEDYQPHGIRVDIYGGSVRVFYDGSEVINQTVNLNFKGGQMFFSGSTGWATNHHVFDDLEIMHDCQ